MKTALILAALISAPVLAHADCEQPAIRAAIQLHKQNREGSGKEFIDTTAARFVFSRGGVESYIATITARNPFSGGGSFKDYDYSVRLQTGSCKVIRIKKLR